MNLRRIGLMLVAATLVGCGSQPQVQTVLEYQIDAKNGEVLSNLMLKDVARVVDHRVNRGDRKRGSVQVKDDGTIVVSLFDENEQSLIALKNWLDVSGTLEFRITANKSDPRHQKLIELASKSDNDVVLDSDQKLGYWVKLNSGRALDILLSELVLRENRDGVKQALVVCDEYNISGVHFQSAKTDFDTSGNHAVFFEMTPDGAALLAELTGRNQSTLDRSSKLGIIFNDELMTAATIHGVLSKEGQISGSDFTADAVELMVVMIESGQLPVKLKLVGETNSPAN